MYLNIGLKAHFFRRKSVKIAEISDHNNESRFRLQIIFSYITACNRHTN
jgi:hypothetical protein